MKESLEIAAELCRKFEGLILKPYLCPANYWTIGYGTVNKPDGTKITKDHPEISKETAEDWLMYELKQVCLPGVLRASPILVKYPKALGAIIDFTYNLGVGRYRASTLRQRINQENFSDASFEIKRWIFGGGRKLPGLVKRREFEAKLLN